MTIERSWRTAAEGVSMTGDQARYRRHPLRWLLPALAVIAWLVMAGLLGPLFSKTSQVQKNDNASFLPANAESTTVQTLDRNFTSAQTTPAVVVYLRDSGLTATDKAKIQSDVSEMSRQ